MKKTRVCELFGIEYPIIQGGMGWVANAELVAAVSNAGGLGMLCPFAGAGANVSWPDNLRRLIRRTRELTDKPFGVNIGLEVGAAKECIDMAIEEKVGIITTAAGSPALYTKYLKQAGIKVMHTVFSVRHARRAEAEGVDAVIASGVDAGGLTSPLELPTLTLIPQVVDSVSIPVVAAGGIADARGLVAALALGAQGVQMGTRFIATTECPAHPSYKEAIIKAMDTDTAITGRKAMISARVIKNEFATDILEMEAANVPAHELQEHIGAGRLRLAIVDGDMKKGSIMCSSAVGLIKEVVSVAQVIKSLVEGYSQVVSRLS